MIGLVLVTHGRLFRAALEHVMGPQKQIVADYEFEHEDDPILSIIEDG